MLTELIAAHSPTGPHAVTTNVNDGAVFFVKLVGKTGPVGRLQRGIRTGEKWLVRRRNRRSRCQMWKYWFPLYCRFYLPFLHAKGVGYIYILNPVHQRYVRVDFVNRFPCCQVSSIVHFHCQKKSSQEIRRYSPVFVRV